MRKISNEELVEKAAGVVNYIRTGEHISGDVGCALVTDRDNVYLGVCIDTSCGIGFCAEHSAIAAMVTAGESRIKKIVAVFKNEQGISLILPPCGRCREFIYQVNKENIDTEIILRDQVVNLAELLPYPWN
jgi:cytidine deaminase